MPKRQMKRFLSSLRRIFQSFQNTEMLHSKFKLVFMNYWVMALGSSSRKLLRGSTISTRTRPQRIQLLRNQSQLGTNQGRHGAPSLGQLLPVMRSVERNASRWRLAVNFQSSKSSALVTV